MFTFTYLYIILLRFIYITSTFEYDFYTDMLALTEEKFNNSLNNSIEYNKCINTLKVYINNTLNNDDVNTINQLIQYSGKSYTDLGMYYQCIKDNLSYFLFVYEKYPLQRTGNENEDVDILRIFLNQTYYLYGLCVPNECSSLINLSSSSHSNNSNNNNSLPVKRFFNEIFDSVNYTIYQYTTQKPSMKELLRKNLFISIIFILCIFIIKVSVYIYLSFIKKPQTPFNKHNIEDYSSSEEYYPDNSIDHKDLPIFPSTLDELTSIKSNKSNNKCQSFCTKFIELFDISKACSIAFSKVNKYYNDTNLELINFLRCFVLILMIYNHNFYAMIKISVKNSENTDYYESFKLTVFKLSTFSVPAWISLDGFVMSYKLLSYIKKKMMLNRKKHFLLKDFLLFYLYSIIKVITLGIIFILLSFFTNQINDIFQVPPMFRYFLDNLNDRICTKQPLQLLNVFPFLYYGYGFNAKSLSEKKNEMHLSRGFINCFKYVNVSINTHICFIFVMIIIYFSFKLKHKCYDIVLITCLFVNIILVYFTTYQLNEQSMMNYFSVDYLFGENYSMKYTHLFINIYLIGVFAGIIYFYYIDVISPKPLDAIIHFHPFECLFKFMKMLDSSAVWVRTCLFVVLVAVIAMLSMLYYIIIKVKGNLLFDIKWYDIIDLYEKYVFVICFMMLTLITLFIKGSSSFKSFYSISIFSMCERISYSIFCSMDNAIYLFYTMYYIILVLDFNNLFMMTIGLCFVIIFFNFMYYILIEQPLRIILKNIIGSNSIYKEVDYAKIK